jgi:hypothetical protein
MVDWESTQEILMSCKLKNKAHNIKQLSSQQNYSEIMIWHCFISHYLLFYYTNISVVRTNMIKSFQHMAFHINIHQRFLIQDKCLPECYCHQNNT